MVLADADVAMLSVRAQEIDGYDVTVDLERRRVSDAHGFAQPFAIDEAARDRLLNGLDDIGLILQHEAAIAAYELAHGDGVVGTRR